QHLTTLFSVTSALFSHFCHTESPVIPVESVASTHFPITTEGGGGERILGERSDVTLFVTRESQETFFQSIALSFTKTPGVGQGKNERSGTSGSRGTSL